VEYVNFVLAFFSVVAINQIYPPITGTKIKGIFYKDITKVIIFFEEKVFRLHADGA
jgi:hypothetical protein